MPVQIDLPIFSQAATEEDVNKYAKLPYYLAKLEAGYFNRWQTFDKLWGSVNWTPNTGPRMIGVRGEPTPVSQQTAYPNPITQAAKKNVVETYEVTEDATVKWQKFRSLRMRFLPSFQDFRTGQLGFVHDDMMKQMAIYNDVFIRSVMLQKTPYTYISGAASPLVSAPIIPFGTDITAANVTASGKNTNWFAAMVADAKANMSLAVMDNLTAIMRDDVGAPYFEGGAGQPKDNQLLNGKFVLIGSMEAYQALKWDPNFSKFKSMDMNVVNDGFRGSIFDEITWRSERYPMRIKADGTIPAPETFDNDTKRTIPSKDYVDAPYEVAWLCGANAFRSIKVGPPPSEFAGKSVSKSKFYTMKWNGEIYLTDQILIEYSKDDGTIGYESNVEGEMVQFYSTLVLAAMPTNARYVLPIIFKRVRPGVVLA